MRTETKFEGYLDATGYGVLQVATVVRELMAFAMITLGVTLTKFRVARRVIRPLVYQQIWNSGVRVLPMVSFLAMALGLLIIGQTVALLAKVGEEGYIGTIMVAVVIRELGPLLAAAIVLARSGTATVIELGTSRALGEVEVLESLGIDPIHYLVVPRVVGLAVATFCLTTYMILVALLSGWVFAFLRDVPLTPVEYFGQLGDALRWEDFVLLGLKTVAFGSIIAVVNCYHGLARPLRIEEVPQVTTRAVVETIAGCVLIDAVFLVGYFFI